MQIIVSFIFRRILGNYNSNESKIGDISYHREVPQLQEWVVFFGSFKLSVGRHLKLGCEVEEAPAHRIVYAISFTVIPLPTLSTQNEDEWPDHWSEATKTMIYWLFPKFKLNWQIFLPNVANLPNLPNSVKLKIS